MYREQIRIVFQLAGARLIMEGADRFKCVFSAADIQARVVELGRQITDDYRGKDLVVVCILKGALFFAADLCRQIDLPLTIDTLGLSSYGDDTKSSGVVRITQDLSRPIWGKDVIVVEDIVDTGLTLKFLTETLKSKKPRSVEVCTLLHKPGKATDTMPLKYVGFPIDDKFVVGYGLDFEQRYRNLPFIGSVENPE
jgi:hypoxanthine phosphoribosyltransferase